MAVYAVIIREEPISNQAEYDECRAISKTNTVKYDLKPLTMYGPMETLEGEPADGVVVLEFPTMEEAKRWYFSDVYQKAVPHRLKSAPYRAMLVQGV